MLAILLAVVLANGGDAAPTQHYWYAAPDKFPVPKVVLQTLKKGRCVIPQSGAIGPLQNVVSGHFLTTHRIDYAALCSDHQASEVVVIDGVNGRVIARLNRQPDANHLMPLDGATLFVREIDRTDAATQPFCLEEAEPCPCRRSGLDGIVDVYEKWSETHCWDSGWHTVTSGD